MQSLQSVLFTLINHEAVTVYSPLLSLTAPDPVGEGIQQTCRLGCYLVKARVHSLATVIGQTPSTFNSS